MTAWQDLALHLIARYCGPEHAVRTAKVYLLGGHENGQLPFAAMTRRARRTTPPSGGHWPGSRTSFGAPNPVARWPGRPACWPRTFARRFLATTGRRPIDYVHGLRIEAARQRLERGDDAVEDIGYAVGYEDPAFFRRLFKRTTGMTPAGYRRAYARIATESRSVSPSRDGHRGGGRPPGGVSPLHEVDVADVRVIGRRRVDDVVEADLPGGADEPAAGPCHGVMTPAVGFSTDEGHGPSVFAVYT